MEGVYYNELHGVKNPQWRSQVKAGVQAGTPLEAHRYEYSGKPYLIENYFINHPPVPTPWWWEYWHYNANYGDYQVPWMPLKSQALNLSEDLANSRALSEYVKKIRRKQTTFQGGVFLGEFLETIRLIRGSAKTLRSGFDSYFSSLDKERRRLKKLPRKRRNEAIADRWLEYSFGWTPLINDIDDGARALAESKILSDRQWTPVRAFGVDEGQVNINPSRDRTLGTWPYIEFDWYQKYRVTVRYMGSVDVGTYSVLSPRRVGLDLSSFLPTVWELVPWSFLVDYFTNVGEIVSAASLATSSVRWTVKTVRKEYWFETHGQTPVYHPGSPDLETIPGYWRAGKAIRRVKTVSRAPYVGSLIPDLTFSLPGFGTKWLNIAALGQSSRRLSRLLR